MRLAVRDRLGKALGGLLDGRGRDGLRGRRRRCLPLRTRLARQAGRGLAELVDERLELAAHLLGAAEPGEQAVGALDDRVAQLADTAQALLEHGLGVALGVLDDPPRLLLGGPAAARDLLLGLVADGARRGLGRSDDRADALGNLGGHLVAGPLA